MTTRQLALVLVREKSEQEIGHGERQHPVTEKLQAFVAMWKGRLQLGLAIERTAVGERFGRQLGASERMTDLASQRREVDVARLQWIAMKKRLKRMAWGHFHGSIQPATLGSCEKKMNSARPTRFSEGTYQPN